MLYHLDPVVTWERLVILEPRIATAKTMKEISQLVGWSANTRHPVLRSSDAYHVALDILLSTGKRTVLPQQQEALVVWTLEPAHNSALNHVPVMEARK